MRAIDWQQFFQKQRDEHGKVVFTITELANVSSLDPRSLKASLQRLVERDVIQRYTKGRYGLAGAVSVEDLVPSLDPAGYITGMYALYGHQLVTQSPVEITCFTNRRHNRSRERVTPLGRIIFVCVTASVYRHPEESVLASPEQALCDFVYLCRKRGVVPSDIVSFRNMVRLNTYKLRICLQKYPASVRHEIERLL